MSEELVEALAKRLAMVISEHRDQIMAEFNNDPAGRAELSVNTAIARECIRQMEFARRRCITGNTAIEVDETTGAIYATKIACPLSLAPPDWTPEAKDGNAGSEAT